MAEVRHERSAGPSVTTFDQPMAEKARRTWEQHAAYSRICNRAKYLTSCVYVCVLSSGGAPLRAVGSKCTVEHPAQPKRTGHATEYRNVQYQRVLGRGPRSSMSCWTWLDHFAQAPVDRHRSLQ